jgi:hypothetical protein
MNYRTMSWVAIATLGIAAAQAADVEQAAGSSAAPADFSGDWQRYGGFGRGPAGDPATLPPPAAR